MRLMILKCKEKDLGYNLDLLCSKFVETIPGIPSVVGKGRYFYIILRNVSEVRKLPLEGRFVE